MKKSKKLALILICFLVLIVSAGCSSKGDNNQDGNKKNTDHSNMNMD